MASEADVDRTLKELIRKLDDASVKERALPEKRKLRMQIRDLDLVYIANFGSGRITGLKRSQEEPGDEDVRISVGSDDLVALASGRMGVASAMLTGRLRIDAGVRDLLLIRQLF
ncbi:MAG: SCP2 sterol-binding domain-containing protein [Actinomycetota bacterium]